MFQHKLHQSTNTFDYHGNDGTLDRSICSDPDESFGYYDINHVVTIKRFFKQRKNSTVRKLWKCGKREVKEKA